MALEVKFWGVRGSIACPGPRHTRYGGNTSCLQINAGAHRIVLDAGTGLRSAGQAFMKEGGNGNHLFLLLTHTHWDHINGFPFFVPAYRKDWTIHIKAGHLKDKGGIQAVLSAQMASAFGAIRWNDTSTRLASRLFSPTMRTTATLVDESGAACAVNCRRSAIAAGSAGS